MAKLSDLLSKYSTENTFKELHWEGSFEDYLNIVKENPIIVCNSYQRIYDMILEAGFKEYKENRTTLRHWNFFDDSESGGKDAVFGLDRQLDQLVNLLKGGALGFGTDRRILLLHGPVGSAKSTIVRLLKKGLEKRTRSDKHKLYTFSWKEAETGEWVDCPMHEEPLKLIPEDFRDKFVEELFEDTKLKYPITTHKGDLDPCCQKFWNLAMEEHKGNWNEVVKHNIKIKRVIFSEKDRIGIGTYQPKDEKSQDATELTGDINYRKIAKYGSDSDPRAFNFDGEFNIANRGIMEFVEILKLETAFLYDLLGATQEKKIKPRKFAQTDIDEVIIGHTNQEEFQRLKNNELMHAFKDRTIRIDIPYNLKLTDELKIYEKEYKSSKKHIAPHSLLVASMWSVMTRLTTPNNSKLTLIQKMKLYNGKMVPGFTVDNVKELKEESLNEGMFGVSPRFIQDRISNTLVSEKFAHVNPFIVMSEIEEGMRYNSLITSEDSKKKFVDLLQQVKEEYTNIVKNEVQRAICSDEEAIARLCANYIDNIKAYCQKERVKNKYTNHDEEPDELLMRSIEEKIDISNSRKDDFRRECLNFIGALAIEGKQFHYSSDERLKKALELKLFEDSRHSIKFSSILSDVVDKATQEKIDVIKSRLIKNYGYTDESASDILSYVSSIFSRGDPKDAK